MENPQKQVQSDEIDLSQLLSKIGNFINGLGKSFVQLLAVLRKVPIENRWLFLALIAISLVLTSVYLTTIKKRFYESTMILSSNYLNKRLVENTIDKLNLLALEEDHSGLTRELGIGDTLAASVVKFEAKPFVSEKDITELEVLKEQLKSAQENAKNTKVIEQVLRRIEIENRHAFEITVRTLNPSVVSDLQTAVVGYFQNNPYIKKRIESNRKALEDRRVKLLIESKKLDSLKEVIYDNYRSMAEQGRQGSNNVILSDRAVTNPIEIYAQDINLYNEIQAITTQLFVQPDFEVVDGFTEFNAPASASAAKSLALCVLISIGMGYLIVALLNFNKYLASLG